MRDALRWLLALPLLLLAVLAWYLLSRGEAPMELAPRPSVVVGAEWPQVVVLPSGAELRIEAPPTSIVAANASAVDMLHVLVDPERVAGLPDQALRYSLLAEAEDPFPNAQRFARFMAEPVIAIEPDLVICDPWGAVETVARLREVGVPVLELPQIRDLQDVRETLRLLGQVLGETDRAERKIAELDGRVAALALRAAERPVVRAISYANGGGGGWSAGVGTTNHELIVLAGMRNLTAEAGHEGHVRMSFETLLATDPDLILVSALEFDEGSSTTAEFLLGEPKLAGLRAVRQGRIAVLPPRLFASSSQEIVSGAEYLADELDRLIAAPGFGTQNGRKR